MSVKELFSLLQTIPYGILTYDNTDYEFKIDVPTITIRFKYDNAIYCYITVFPNYTSFYGYSTFLKSVAHDNCVKAMKNTMAYLEILGFKNVN